MFKNEFDQVHLSGLSMMGGKKDDDKGDRPGSGGWGSDGEKRDADDYGPYLPKYREPYSCQECGSSRLFWNGYAWECNKGHLQRK
ncbi:hypothetical protein [Thermoflavimicrobium daqui]|uniref:Uncharacterized protein n=1 Tax=Thermoflavimicrobium daqui TaxID=2137476 RepID=A0A364K1V4_9BACL|nr:hypothetical protein [Thermoflavimicrobium daqui]RAL22004.1 hypothetical protein DL897_15595 [Thermoflavimicrobium daqui]